MPFSEPSDELKKYAKEHNIEMDLTSDIVQQALELRMAHPEWEQEQSEKEAKAKQWVGKLAYYIEDEHIYVGRINQFSDGTLWLALADEHQYAAQLVREHIHTLTPGIFDLPPDLPIHCSFERFRGLPNQWRSIEQKERNNANY